MSRESIAVPKKTREKKEEEEEGESPLPEFVNRIVKRLAAMPAYAKACTGNTVTRQLESRRRISFVRP